MPAYELYAFWRSSAGYRVRVALALKGLTATEHSIDLDAGQQLSPAFLAINPAGAVPALVIDGNPPITQSTAILEYLDETVPSPPLLPPDAIGRARVRSICAQLAADTHPLVVPRIRKYLTAQAGFDAAAWRAWQVQWFGAGLRTVEARLANDKARLADDPATGAFCHGDTVTMADILLCSILAVMGVFDVRIDGTHTVDRIVAHCNTLPAFANAAPHRQAGAPAR